MSENPVIFFDGICVFCNSFLQFIIRRDGKKFKFCALQSQASEDLSVKYNFVDQRKNLSSLILLKNGKIFEKSSAVIEIFLELGGVWNLLYLFKIIPKKIGDFCYDAFAKRRYQWFGRAASCDIAPREIKERMI